MDSRTQTERRLALRKALGPGLLWAATAIGVSHLVQSTRAGAGYGFALVGVVLGANLLKYPFFEFGPRYAVATGESLLEGYRRLGRWAVIVYLTLTVGTMFAIVGAVTLVTGSLATQLFGAGLSPLAYSVILLAVCAMILILGRYPLLDAAVKVIIALLAASTLTAGVAAALHGPRAAPDFIGPTLWTRSGFLFLIALVGWMPSAVDISVWQSLWSLERTRQTGYRPTLGEALFDFNLGYVGTAFLAVVFLSLGALVMYGSGQQLAPSATAFAAQLINLYTETLGPWARPVIAVAAFTTMFSTTLTCADAFPRVLRRATEILAPELPRRGPTEWLYWLWMVIVMTGSVLLISRFAGRLRLMVDIATSLAFVVSPVLSYFNYRVVTADHVPREARPPRWLRVLAWIGLVFGTVFALVYLVVLLRG